MMLNTKPLYGAKHSLNIFNKIDGYIRTYDKARELASFQSENSDGTFHGMRCFIRWKSNISSVYSHNTKIKIDFDDDLPLAKAITMHNIVLLIKSAFNEYYNQYHYQVFLEKYSYK